VARARGAATNRGRPGASLPPPFNAAVAPVKTPCAARRLTIAPWFGFGGSRCMVRMGGATGSTNRGQGCVHSYIFTVFSCGARYFTAFFLTVIYRCFAIIFI